MSSHYESVRNAAQYLEARYVNRWKGCRATTTQALAFPRDAIELDGVLLPSSPLPTRLKSAHAELAIRAVVAPLMPDVDEPGSLTVDRKKVGPIEVEKHWDSGGLSQIPWLRLVDSLLNGLIYDGADLIRA